jgi:hypothetical protein
VKDTNFWGLKEKTSEVKDASKEFVKNTVDVVLGLVLLGGILSMFGGKK